MTFMAYSSRAGVRMWLCAYWLSIWVCAAKDSSRGYDADLTVFSPEGKLFQVEYIMRAVEYYGAPLVAVGGDDCCVVASKKVVEDDLVYADSTTSLFRVTDDIYCGAVGMPGDVRFQVKKARLECLEYKRQYGSSMSSRLLALRMADAAQINTQQASMRPMACVSVLLSVDDEDGPALFRVEPSGQFFQVLGTAAGKGTGSSLDFLEGVVTRQKTRDRANESDSPDRQVDSEGSADRGGEARPPGVIQESSGRLEEETPVDTCLPEDPGTRKSDDNSKGVISPGRSPPSLGIDGEDETVLLAIEALEKASSGTKDPPLSMDNLEIAVASDTTGVRICGRAEVKNFWGLKEQRQAKLP